MLLAGLYFWWYAKFRCRHEIWWCPVIFCRKPESLDWSGKNTRKIKYVERVEIDVSLCARRGPAPEGRLARIVLLFSAMYKFLRNGTGVTKFSTKVTFSDSIALLCPRDFIRSIRLGETLRREKTRRKKPRLCVMTILIPCNVAAPLASDHGFLTELIFSHTFS